MRSATAALLLLLSSACGSSGGPRLETGAPSAGPFEPAKFLLEFGERRTTTLRPPERDVEALEAAVRATRGPERIAALRDLAIANLLAAETAEEREATRHRRAALRHAESAARWTREDWVKTEMAFVEVWSAWRAGRGNASGVAERFVRRNPRGGDLVFLAWMIRGEAAFDREEWQDAADAFRFALGSIEHPLYAYALYRTAKAQEHQGRADDSRQALREVVQLGCPADASEEARELAARAQSELGMPDVTREDGTRRAQICERAPAASE